MRRASRAPALLKQRRRSARKEETWGRRAPVREGRSFPNLSEIAGAGIALRSGLSLAPEGLHETGDERAAALSRIGSALGSAPSQARGGKDGFLAPSRLSGKVQPAVRAFP